jgi:hypothetical protein
MIWRLQIPNSSIVFLWKACHNILPTKANLKKRRVISEEACIFCCGEAKTIKHILWDYPSTQDVWSASSRKFQKTTRGEGGGTFLEFV